MISKPLKEQAVQQFELFDYQNDPDESQHHAIEYPAVVEELKLFLDGKH